MNLKLILVAACLFSFTAKGATHVTNFFWSASYTSNYIRTNIMDKLNQIVLNAMTTNSPAVSSNIVATINRPQGFLSLVTQQTLALSSGVYNAVTNYQLFNTNKFSYNLGDGVLTNEVAGEYQVSWQVSLTGGNSDDITVAVFTNTVESALQEAEILTAASALKTSMSGNGIIALPANCRVELKIINNTDNDDVTLERVQLTVKQ